MGENTMSEPEDGVKGYEPMSIYERIKADIVQPYYVDNFPNDGQRFVAWYLRNIYGLNTVQAKDCITDGPGDKQIDAVFVDDQAQIVYIIQGKFYSGATIDAQPLREVLSSWMLIKDLANFRSRLMISFRRKSLRFRQQLKMITIFALSYLQLLH